MSQDAGRYARPRDQSAAREHSPRQRRGRSKSAARSQSPPSPSTRKDPALEPVVRLQKCGHQIFLSHSSSDRGLEDSKLSLERLFSLSTAAVRSSLDNELLLCSIDIQSSLKIK